MSRTMQEELPEDTYRADFYYQAFLTAVACVEHEWRDSGGALSFDQRKQNLAYSNAVFAAAEARKLLSNNEQRDAENDLRTALEIFQLGPGLLEAISSDVNQVVQGTEVQSLSFQPPEAVLHAVVA